MKKDFRYENPAEKEKLRNTYILFGIVVVLVIAGFIFLSGAGPQTPYQQTTSFTGPPPENQSANNATCQNDECWIKAAASLKDATMCENIANVEIVQQCYEQLAGVSFETCLKITNTTKKTECVTNHAVEKKSVELCTNILEESERNKCSAAANPCTGKNGSALGACLAENKLEYGGCKKETWCIIEYANKTEDTTMCSQLETEGAQGACAALIKSKDTCGELAFPSVRNYCHDLYAKWSSDKYACDSIQKDSTYAIDCYSYFAKLDKNYTYCKKIDLDNSWSCYKNYSIETGDPLGCTQIHKYARFTKIGCFVDTAINNRNPSACTYINETEDAGSRINCYISTILANTTVPIPPDNCGNIIHDGWKQKCYTYSATGNKNASICNLITNNAEKTLCEGKFK